MAVAPSSNLLSALSQLQGPRPAAAPQRTQPASTGTGAAATSATRQTGFAAQLGSISTGIQVADQRPATPAPVQSQQQSRPIPTRGGYLGQHVNILV